MRILKAGVIYFALVYAAGFALGTIRVLFIVPNIGTRAAELAEMPLMFVVTVFAARRVARRCALPPSPTARLGTGFVGLGLLLLTEFTVVLWLRGQTIREYFASRDPVAGAAHLVMLVAFAVMPLLVARR